MVWTFVPLYFAAAQHWPRKICSCVSSWPYFKNVRSRPQGPQPRIASSWRNWPAFRLAQGFDHREPGYFDRLASNCFPPLLALEVAAGRETTSLGGSETTDPPDGGGKSDLG
jgi:hypothetical protein